MDLENDQLRARDDVSTEKEFSPYAGFEPGTNEYNAVTRDLLVQMNDLLLAQLSGKITEKEYNERVSPIKTLLGGNKNN